MSDSNDQVIKKNYKVNHDQSKSYSKLFNMCSQSLLYEAQSTNLNQRRQTTQEIIISDIIIEINNGQGTCNSRQIVPERVDNKAAERSRLYRERHKEKINQRRREVRHCKIEELKQIQALTNKQNRNEMEQITQATSNNKSVSSNSHKQRQQRYYERHREELNKRKRDNRLKQRGPHPIAATAAERGRKYRERNKHEINERRRHSRRQQQYVQRAHAEYGDDRLVSGTVQSPLGRLVESNQADVSKIISLVKQRPLLFARCDMPVASYKSQVKSLWKEVADEIGCGVTEIRRKWSRIRNAYSRHLRTEVSGASSAKGSAVLANDLDFLKEHITTDIAPNSEDAYRTEELVTLPEEDLINVNLNIEVSPMRDSSTSDVRDDCSWRSSVYSWRDAQEQHQEQSASSEPVELNQCWLQESQDPMLPEPGYFQSHENSAYFQFFRSIFDDYKQLVPSKQRLFRRQCLSYLHELLDQSEEPVLVPHAVILSSSADPSVRNLCTVVKVEPFDNSST